MMLDASSRSLPLNSSALTIAQECDSIKDLLLGKNAKYGDSALNPIRVFSKASNVDQLLVRIDDKLSRIARGVGLVASDEDVIQDLIGYLVLLKIALKGQNTPGFSEDVYRSLLEEHKDREWEGHDIEPEYACKFSHRSPD
jgi:hypothetical protein